MFYQKELFMILIYSSYFIITFCKSIYSFYDSWIAPVIFFIDLNTLQMLYGV